MTLCHKGISGREAGHRLTNNQDHNNQKDDNQRQDTNKDTVPITMDNVHHCTTYNLRQ